MFVFQIIFFAVIATVSFFIAIKGIQEHFAVRYMLFGLLISFWFVVIFQVKPVLLLLLFCASGLTFYSSLAAWRKTILFLGAAAFSGFYWTPSMPADFNDHLKKAYGLHCKSTECVKLSGDEDPVVHAEISAIRDYSFHSYFLWAEGKVITDKHAITAHNVMGVWFPVHTE